MSFCHAVAEGEVETVRALLARGEDPNKEEEGSTPIACAMSLLSSNTGPGLVRDVFACIKLCLDAGADPNVSWDERVCGIAEERFRKMSGKELIDEFERRKDTMTPEQLEKVRKSCGVYLRRRGEIVDSDESDSEEELYVRLRGLVG